MTEPGDPPQILAPSPQPAQRQVRTPMTEDPYRAEEAISGELYRELIHAIDGIFWEAEAIGERFLFVSPQAESILGYKVSEWLERSKFWIEHVHPEDQERVQEARAWWVSSCLSGGSCQPSQELEYRMIGAAGQVVWIRDQITVIPEADPPRLRGLMMDITRSKRQEWERVRAERLLQQQAQRQQAIFQISQRIRQFLDLDSVLNTTVQEVQKLLQTDRALIYQFDPETWQGRVRVEVVRSGWPAMLQTQISDPCFGESYAALYRQGRIQVISDIYAAGLAPCYLELLASFQIRANLVVPIITEQQLWGLLIAHQCQGPRHWQIQDAQLLEQLATQVGIAIQQAEFHQDVQRLNQGLEQQVQERTQRLQQTLEAAQVLQRITDQICWTLDEQQILQTATRELRETLQVDYCCVCLYDLDQQEARVECEQTCPGHPSNLGQIIPMEPFYQVYDQLLAGGFYDSRQSTNSPDPGDHLCLRPSLRPATTLICPMLLPGGEDRAQEPEVLGDIGLFHSQQRPLEDFEISLVQQVADQCAIAIRQARLYQAAQLQVSELRRLNQLKDDFLSTVSHELRTPMSNIKMATFMLKQASLEARYLSYLQILERECTREIELINDLLELQRLEAHTPQLTLKSLDLNLWILELTRRFQAKTEERQQRIEVSVKTSLPILVTDPSCLSSVLTELVHNACKYAPPGSSIHLQLRAQGSDQVQFRISNSGQIPAEESERIFERFYRIPNADPWKQGGTGLGLALVKKRVEQLRGTIELIPDPQQVIFQCTLPSLQPQELP